MTTSIYRSLHRMLAAGVSLGSMLFEDVRDNLRFAIEHLEEDRRKVRFGDLRDVTSPDGNSFSLDGIHAAKHSISNVALFAHTGMGKSQVCVLNSLARINGPTVICFDPSSTVMPVVAPRFDRLNYRISAINYSDILNSSSLNFIELIKSDEDAHRFSAHLAHASHDRSKGDIFFVESAASLNAFLIKLLIRADKRYHNCANLLRLLNAYGTKGGLNQLAAKLCSEAMWTEYKALIANNSEKTIGSIVLSCKLMLSYWSSDAMARVTAQSTVNLDSLRERKQVIFINTNTYDSEYYSTLNSLTLNSCMEALMREVRPDARKVLFIIDEAATCNLPNLSAVVSNTRKYGIYNLLCYQNRAQLKTYGHDMDNILANTSHLYYGPQDGPTARELSDLFGTVTMQGGKARPLMPIHDITRMPRDRGLFVHRNVPYRLHLTPFHRQRVLQSELGCEPYIFRNNSIPSKVELIPL